MAAHGTRFLCAHDTSLVVQQTPLFQSFIFNSLGPNRLVVTFTRCSVVDVGPVSTYSLIARVSQQISYRLIAIFITRYHSSSLLANHSSYLSIFRSLGPNRPVVAFTRYSVVDVSPASPYSLPTYFSSHRHYNCPRTTAVISLVSSILPLLAYHSSPCILASSIPSLLAYHSSLTLSSRTKLRNFNSFSQLLSSYISSIIVAIFVSYGPGLLIVSPHKVIQNSLGQRRFLN